MSQVNLPNTIASGDADNPTRDMANWTTIRDIINGNLDNTNISATAAIEKSKLQETMLGYAEKTVDQLGIGASSADIGSLEVTVTVPAGGRRIRITGFVRHLNTAATLTYVSIKESTTTLQTDYRNLTAGSLYMTFIPQIILIPSAGSHTYKLATSTDSGTTDVKAGATAPNFILVELI